MVRKFAIGDEVNYLGEGYAEGVRVVGYVDDDGGLGLPIYWVSDGCSHWACGENFLAP